jgi:hypothetical protein
MKCETPEMFEIGSATNFTLAGFIYPHSHDFFTGYTGDCQVP